MLYGDTRTNSADPRFDLNADGSVDQFDVGELVLNIMSTTYRDTDLDGWVRQSDFIILAANFGRDVIS